MYKRMIFCIKGVHFLSKLCHTLVYICLWFQFAGNLTFEEMAETESDNDSWETLEESSDTEDQQDKKVRSVKRFCCVN